jgi:hypothetical protein
MRLSLLLPPTPTMTHSFSMNSSAKHVTRRGPLHSLCPAPHTAPRIARDRAGNCARPFPAQRTTTMVPPAPAASERDGVARGRLRRRLVDLRDRVQLRLPVGAAVPVVPPRDR